MIKTIQTKVSGVLNRDHTEMSTYREGELDAHWLNDRLKYYWHGCRVVFKEPIDRFQSNSIYSVGASAAIWIKEDTKTRPKPRLLSNPHNLHLSPI